MANSVASPSSSSSFHRHCFFQEKTFPLSNKQNAKSRTVICSSLEEHNMETLRSSSSSSSNKALDMNQSEIWNLFKKAQQNILYLNKQRLMAVEELEKTQQEKELLLKRIQQLEVENEATTGKDPMDWSSIFSQMLLRIDSMVLTGLLATEEAFQLRRLITENKFILGDIFSEVQQKGDLDMLTELRHILDKRKRNTFHVIHICTEMAPVASVGSLASYVTGLSRALQEKGNLVEVILPKYSNLNLDEVQGLRKTEAKFQSYFNGHLHENWIWTGVVYDIGVTLIEPLYYSALFNRDMIYGYSDDFERFTYFSRASLDYIVKSGKKPDIIHIHNWETAIVGPLFWEVFADQGLGDTRILLTCHGFRSQCLEKPDKLALCGLDPSKLHRHDRLQDHNKNHLVNVLKGGVVYSNKVLVMSSVHPKSRIVHSMSHGLEPTLATYKDKLSVAPYGFDGIIWDPSTDKLLPANYSSEDVKGKAICKVALAQRLGLSAQALTIIVGCIYHEDSDLDLENLRTTVSVAYRMGAKVIVMGDGKVPSVNATMQSFQDKVKGKNVRFIGKYDEALSHLILAGSDIILCPSFHDPVLQIPLKAIKYGAAPILITPNKDGFSGQEDRRDDESTRSSQYITSTFGNVYLNQALDQINTPQYNQKIKEGMKKDFSWDAECCDIHLAAYSSIKNL